MLKIINPALTPFFTKIKWLTFSVIILLFSNNRVTGQVRQIYLDPSADNEINKISFYSPTEGFVAFTDWIGYTVDSGKTFTQKPITINNVNFNGYHVNLTFGFGIRGVKAFDKNTLIVYGDYGLVPSILYSTDGGNTFTVLYNSQYDPFQLRTGITDMIFPQNDNIGFACDADRILKTTNKGLSWSVIDIAPASYFDHLEAPDDQNIFAMSTGYTANKLVRSTDGGSSWSVVTLPSINQGKLVSTTFLNSNLGWLDMQDYDFNDYFYQTADGGVTWKQENDPLANPFYCTRMKFIDANVGYALVAPFDIYKTSNSGVTWEPLPRDNHYSYLGYYNNDLQCFSSGQFWAGGGHGFLQMTTNGGGTPLPKAFFKIDTTGLYNAGSVTVLNYSKTGYTNQWILNGVSLATSYNTTFAHDVNRLTDTVTLIVSNGALSDTLTKYQYYYPHITVTSFSPVSAGNGTEVTITGTNFTGVTSVTFGGTPSPSFNVVNNTTIRAQVGGGSSGVVKVATTTGKDSLGGFTFIPPPLITSFSPASAVAGTAITITGLNFTGTTAVNFAGRAAAGFVVKSPTSIVAIVPSGPSGYVSVITPGGVDSLSGFTSVPAVSSFAPLHGTQGTIMHITGTSFDNLTAVSIGGVPVASLNVNSSTSITAIVGPGASGDVTVTNAGGSSTLGGFTWYASPVIASFSPISGPVGTTVTISGSGFDPVFSQNQVFFGAVKAVITGGNANSLTVIAPVGATFEPIDVISNNLVGYSSHPYMVTFTGGGGITASSFTPNVFSTGGYYPYNINLSDLDGDGKADLVISEHHMYVKSTGIVIYRNTSSLSAISFNPPIEMGGLGYFDCAAGDLDGDGKPDLAAIKEDSIITFLNTSTAGSISFVRGVALKLTNGPSAIKILDMDGDGKADILTSGAVFRNISEPGALTFAPRYDAPTANGYSLIVTDIDGDGKPDIVVPDDVSENLFVQLNHSTKGNLSIAPPVAAPGHDHSYAVAADVDGDGRTDILYGDNNGFGIAVLYNRSTPGNVNFSVAPEYYAGAYPTGLAVADLDGDGKPDVAAGEYGYSMTVLKNVSAADSAYLLSAANWLPGKNEGENAVAIGDLNGDGKNDVLVTSETNQTLTVYLNNVHAEPFIRSFTPTLGGRGTVVNITGSNFNGISSVTFGEVPAASFTVNSSTSITAVVATGSSGDVVVSNSYGLASRPGYAFGNPPQITSISTPTAPAGESITITGKNFSSVPSENIVYFGGVKANVTASSDQSITVTVPTGTGGAPVSVTVNQLTSYSPQVFNASFAGGPATFGSGSFLPRFDRRGGGRNAFADIDGDGKPELISARGSSGFTVARNTCIPGQVSFDTDVYISTGSAGVLGVATGDIDGDGKQDVVTYNESISDISVALNASTSGNITFMPAINTPVGSAPLGVLDVTIVDVDGDGKPDIVGANYSGSLAIFKNLSTPGHVIIGPRMDYPVKGYATAVTAGDLDGDGRPELIAAVNSEESVEVIQNISIPGTIVLAPALSFPVSSWPIGVEVADMDSDGKLDVVVPNINSNSVSVLRNMSTMGNFSFAVKADFATGAGPQAIALGDLDGDGRPDIAEGNIYSDQTISILKNTSMQGSISMLPKVPYAMPQLIQGMAINDIDGDGRADICVDVLGGTTSIFINKRNDTASITLCAGSDTTLHSSVTGITYQWQQEGSSGFVSLNDNANLSGTATASLHLTGIPDTLDMHRYRCVIDGSPAGTVITLHVISRVIPSVSITATDTSICAGTPVTFTASITGGGTSPVYNWIQNGTARGNNGNEYTNNTLSDGDEIGVLLISNEACATPDTVISNSITMNVHPVVTPWISISGDTSVKPGQATMITTNSTGGGALPLFEWEDSTANHSWMEIAGNHRSFINYTPVTTGDRIRGFLTTSETCLTQATDTSNVLIFSVDTSSTLAIRLFPNPAGNRLLLDNLKLSDGWQKLAIIDMNGSRPVRSYNIEGRTSVTLNISGLSKGYYVLILYRKQGRPDYLKFIKM